MCLTLAKADLHFPTDEKKALLSQDLFLCVGARGRPACFIYYGACKLVSILGIHAGIQSGECYAATESTRSHYRSLVDDDHIAILSQ
jgi:hypothetical protein